MAPPSSSAEILSGLLGLSKKTITPIGKAVGKVADVGGTVIKKGIIPAGVTAGYYGTKALGSLLNSLVENSGDPVSQAALRAAKGVGGFAKKGADAYSGLKSRLFSQTSSDNSTQINNITTSKVSDDSAIVSLLQQILVKVSPVPNIDSSVNKLLALQLLQYRTEKLERLQDLENMRERGLSRGAGGRGGILPAAGKVGLAGLAGLAGSALVDYLTGESGSGSGGGAGSGAGADSRQNATNRVNEVKEAVAKAAVLSNAGVLGGQIATNLPISEFAEKRARRAKRRQKTNLRRARRLSRQSRELRELSAIQNLSAQGMRKSMEDKLFEKLYNEFSGPPGSRGKTEAEAAKFIEEFLDSRKIVEQTEIKVKNLEVVAEKQAGLAKKALDASQKAENAAQRLTKVQKLFKFIEVNSKSALAKLARGLSVIDFGVDAIFGGLSAEEWESSVTASSLGGLIAGGEGGPLNSIFNVLKWAPVAAGGIGLAALAGAPAAVATAIGGTVVGAAGLLGLIGGDDTTKFLESNFPGLKKLDPYTAPIVAGAGRIIESIYNSVASIFSSGDEFRYDVDKWAPLMNALIMTESAGNPYAVGKAGEKGWTQIMPQHFDRLGEMLGVKFDPVNKMHGLLGGTIILEEGIKQVGLDMRKLLVAYNAGPNAIKRAEKRAKEAGEGTDYESIEKYLTAQQRRYVDKVMRRYEEYSKDGGDKFNIGNRISLSAGSIAPPKPIKSGALKENNASGTTIIGSIGDTNNTMVAPTPAPMPTPPSNDPIRTSTRPGIALGL